MSDVQAPSRSAPGVFRRALTAFAKQPAGAWLSVIVIAVLLALPFGGYWLSRPLAAALRAAGKPEITVFMPVGAERNATLRVEEKLKALPGVAKTRLLPREETLSRLQAKGGALLAEAIAVLPDNPFPDAIIVTPADEAPATLEALSATLQQWREIEHVQADAGWARRLSALQRLLQATAWLLGSLLGAALCASVYGTLRLMAPLERAWRASAATQRADFDCAAFLWRGALLGLAGGLVAWLLVAGAILWLQPPAAELAALYGVEWRLTLPDGRLSALLLCASALLGGGAAWLAHFADSRRS